MVKQLLFHHCTPLANVWHGIMAPSAKHSIKSFGHKDRPEVVKELLSPNFWLEQELGFYPLFLAVGSELEDIGMTGYGRQWKRYTGSVYNQFTGEVISEYWKKGEFPNRVLFSYENLDCVFVDYDQWFLVLNSSYNDYQISKSNKRRVLKPSWSRTAWLRKAKNDPCSVMAVVSFIDMRQAKRIWARNKAAKQQLEGLGFENVIAKRVSCEI